MERQKLLNDDISLNKKALVFLMFNHYDVIYGRTRIQKMLYLANQIWDEVISDYLFYEYGPYSEWLKRELEILRQNNFVSEDHTESGDENLIYTYRLTKDGKEFFDKIIKSIDSNLVDKTKSLFRELNEFSTDDLEIITSLLFLKRSDPAKDEEKLINLVKLYKPRFEADKIKNNYKKLENTIYPYISK